MPAVSDTQAMLIQIVFMLAALGRWATVCPTKLESIVNDSFAFLNTSTWILMDQQLFHCPSSGDPGCTWAAGELLGVVPVGSGWMLRKEQRTWEMIVVYSDM